MSESKSCSIHKICKDESTAKSIYRFLNNEKVTEQEIIQQTAKECSENVIGKRVLVIIDTSVIRLSNKKNRLKDVNDLYSTGRYLHQNLYGFHISPALVVEEQSETCCGIAYTKIIKRQGKTRREKGVFRARFHEDIERKESYKWLETYHESKKVLEKAEHATYVMDREADIIELFDRIPNDGSSFLVRSNYNRRTVQEDGSTLTFEEILSNSAVKAQSTLNVQTRHRKKRKAILDIKFEQVKIAWPETKQTRIKNNPEGIPVTVIDIKERVKSGYKDEPPLHWRLISSEEIKTIEGALKQIEFYKRRWRIEEFFKVLKTDGFDIEGTELTKGKSIRKLTLLVMKASVKVLKLKAARTADCTEKITSVFNKDEIECLKYLNKKYDGNTEKQKNPHNEETLCYASWVIARVGGWKEFYDSKRPPGSKTFIYGLEKFDAIMVGFMIDR